MNNGSYLAHHGVKGMKWGVRKQRPKSNRIRSQQNDSQTKRESLKDKAYRYADSRYGTIRKTRLTKKNVLLAVACLGLIGKLNINDVQGKYGSVGEYIARAHMDAHIYSTDAKKYDDQDLTLKKGTQFQRIAGNTNSGITNGVYLSYTNADKDTYLGRLGKMRAQYQVKNEDGVSIRRITMNAKEDIKIPARSKRISEFVQLYQDHPTEVLGLINEHQENRYHRRAKSRLDMSNYQAIERNYRKFNDALSLGEGANNYSVIKKYYDRLSKQGYSAIPDENDINVGGFKADAPIILFDSKKSIGKTRSNRITAGQLYAAEVRSGEGMLKRGIVYSKARHIERLSPNTESQIKAFQKQLNQDKRSLNINYSLDDLAKDWNAKFSNDKIKQISNYMDEGLTHDEAVRRYNDQRTTALGRIAVSLHLSS